MSLSILLVLSRPLIYIIWIHETLTIRDSLVNEPNYRAHNFTNLITNFQNIIKTVDSDINYATTLPKWLANVIELANTGSARALAIVD
jgi:hypothetical protein